MGYLDYYQNILQTSPPNPVILWFNNGIKKTITLLEKETNILKLPFLNYNFLDFVVARFNLHHTRWLFSIFFVVPAGLFVMSCGILFACSRALNVDNSGHMKMECCAQSDMSSNLQFKYAENADTLWK